MVKSQPIWYKHPDDRIDAAVILINPTWLESTDMGAIKVSEFGTPEEIRSVEIGDDVVSAGLVPGLSGQKRNYPIFKFGKVSSIPDEEGSLPCGQQAMPATYWYIAATLVGGNSGSPIFRLPPGNTVIKFGAGRAFLLGLQSMSIPGGEIAGMVPAQYIFEIIESMKLPDADLTRGETPVQGKSPEKK